MFHGIDDIFQNHTRRKKAKSMTQQAEENKQTEQATFEVVYDSLKEGRGKRRTVRLSHDYRYGFEELYTNITGTSISFTKMHDNEEPDHFEMTLDEVDSLIAALQQFRNDCQQAEEAEEKRLEDVKTLTFKAASKYGLTLKELSDPNSRESRGEKYELWRDGRYLYSSSSEDYILRHIKSVVGLRGDTDISELL